VKLAGGKEICPCKPRFGQFPSNSFAALSIN
jgi:hypothetical protein